MWCFVSDHGQMDGAHAERSTIKAHPYEESIGIPLIVRDPRYRHRRGLVVSSPVATEDLFPTLAGLAGVAPPVGLPGADASPLVRGEIDHLPRDGVLLEFVHDLRPAFPYHGVYWRGFRSDRYKYTVLGDAETGGTPWQFYDLQDDPYEMHNRVDDPASRGLVVQHHRWMRERMVADKRPLRAGVRIRHRGAEPLDIVNSVRRYRRGGTLLHDGRSALGVAGLPGWLPDGDRAVLSGSGRGLGGWPPLSSHEG